MHNYKIVRVGRSASLHAHIHTHTHTQHTLLDAQTNTHTLSLSHTHTQSQHHWTGTDSVSNNVRLEVEKKWLGGQKTLPTGALLHEHSRQGGGSVDSITRQQFQEVCVCVCVCV